MLTRPRLLLLVAGLACAALACRYAVLAACGPATASAPQSARAEDSGLAAARVGRSDKPAGPVDLQLIPSVPAADGQRVHATLRPVRTLSSVTWHWELSEGVILAQGAASGTATPDAGALSAFDVLLLPPPGGRPGRATLVAEATFPGADDAGPTGPETAVLTAELRWGEEPDSPVPVVTAVDGATGEPTTFALLPAGQPAGR